MFRSSAILSAVYAALAVLRQNLWRSLMTLTICGLGCGGVIVSAGLADMQLADIESRMRSLGGHLVVVSPNKVPPTPGRVRQLPHFISLVPEDGNAVREQIAGIRLAVPVLARNTTVRLDQSTSRVRLIGSTPDYFAIRRFTLSTGRFFREADDGDRVIVLGHAAARELSDAGAITGATVMLGGQPYSVRGVLAPQGINFAGEDEDHQVFIPLETYRHRIANRDWLHFLYLELDSAARSSAVVADVQRLLHARHGRFRDQVPDVVVRDLAELASEQAGLQATALWAVAVTSGLLLLMGLIGIVTLMLLVVRQRRGEIGLRRALGATPADIAMQFFLEGLSLSTLGILAGSSGGMIMTAILTHSAETSVAFDPNTALLPAAISLAASAAACVWPALTAARLEPATALRP